MSKRYHVGENGPARCRARIRTCPLGNGDHFDSMEKAEFAFEKQNIESTLTKGLKKGEKYSIETVDEHGVRRWVRSDNEMMLHREDGPAEIHPDGTKKWYRDGLSHREDGPAIERPNGTREWRKYGVVHREDGPAFEMPGGTREWWLNGVRHRDDGGPAVEHPKYNRLAEYPDWRPDGTPVDPSTLRREWWQKR